MVIRRSLQSGSMLIELLVVTAISSVVTLATSSLLIFSIEQFNILVQQHKTQENLLWASYHIRSYFSQAVNLQQGTGSATSCSLSEAKGNLRDQGWMVPEYNDVTTPCSGMAVIAVFPRENATDTNGVDLFVSAIFYEPAVTTSSNGEPSPGRLYFDVGERSANRAVNLTPDDTDIIYSGIHDFKIHNVETMRAFDTCQNNMGSITCGVSNLMIKTATVTLTFRYFLFPDGKRGERHDYATNSQTLNYVDISQEVNINFHNNIMTKCKNVMTGCDENTQHTYKERLFGNIYFYKMIIPASLIL